MKKTRQPPANLTSWLAQKPSRSVGTKLDPMIVKFTVTLVNGQWVSPGWKKTSR